MALTLKGDKEINKVLTINQKALQINLNDNIYGTFAEIGAGQEKVLTLQLPVDAPAKWSHEHPNLYPLYLELRDSAGNVSEVVTCDFGFRELEIKDSMFC